MNIGLIDGDFNLKKSKIYPNLALMKLAAYHKQKGDTVSWHLQCLKYDKVYISKVFSFGDDPLKVKQISAIEIEVGGTFYSLTKKLPNEIEHIRPDYSLYTIHKRYKSTNSAYGFTTRGCIRKCSFCIVPKKEGVITTNTDIDEFWTEGQSLILMDNNILASDHGIKQIEKIAKLKIPVDFNQGLDARLVDYELAELLCKVKHKTNYLRFAFDNMSQYTSLENISKWFLEITGRERIQSMAMVYCLIDEFVDSYNRLNLLKKIDMCPSPQIVMDLKTGERKDNLGNWFLYRWSCMPAVFNRPFEKFIYKGYTGKEILESKELRNMNRHLLKTKRKYS